MQVVAHADGAGDESKYRHQQARHFFRPGQPRVETIAQNDRQRHNGYHRQNGGLRDEQHDSVRDVVEPDQRRGKSSFVHGRSPSPSFARLHNTISSFVWPFRRRPSDILILCERAPLS